MWPYYLLHVKIIDAFRKFVRIVSQSLRSLNGEIFLSSGQFMLNIDDAIIDLCFKYLILLTNTLKLILLGLHQKLLILRYPSLDLWASIRGCGRLLKMSESQLVCRILKWSLLGLLHTVEFWIIRRRLLVHVRLKLCGIRPVSHSVHSIQNLRHASLAWVILLWLLVWYVRIEGWNRKIVVKVIEVRVLTIGVTALGWCVWGCSRYVLVAHIYLLWFSHINYAYQQF